MIGTKFEVPGTGSLGWFTITGETNDSYEFTDVDTCPSHYFTGGFIQKKFILSQSNIEEAKQELDKLRDAYTKFPYMSGSWWCNQSENRLNGIINGNPYYYADPTHVFDIQWNRK